jgi:hypothetical protein
MNANRVVREKPNFELYREISYTLALLAAVVAVLYICLLLPGKLKTQALEQERDQLTREVETLSDEVARVKSSGRSERASDFFGPTSASWWCLSAEGRPPLRADLDGRRWRSMLEIARVAVG